ncbi:MAG: hypothetical protein SFU87_12340 [Chitinophagaceae bacterium]|nr:hypothetical protein [Chitinophagaceae bacterium]
MNHEKIISLRHMRPQFYLSSFMPRKKKEYLFHSMIFGYSEDDFYQYEYGGANTKNFTAILLHFTGFFLFTA